MIDRAAGETPLNGGGRITTPSAFLFLAICLIYIGSALMMVFITPLGEGPDEIGHVDMVLYLRKNATLPPLRFAEELPAQNFQPPLYYVLGSLIVSPSNDTKGGLFSNPDWNWAQPVPTFLRQSVKNLASIEVRFWYVLRLYSALCGFITLLLLFWIARHFFEPVLSVACVASVALNPQFLFLHSIVTNDTLAITLATAILLQALRLTAAPKGCDWFLAGVFVGLAALTKFSAVPISFVLVIPLLNQLRASSKASRNLFLRNLFFFSITSVVLAAPLIIRNFLQTGSITALPAANPENLWLEPLMVIQLPQILPQMVPQVFASYWGTFGWMNIPLPLALYLIPLGITMASLVGWVLSLKNQKVAAVPDLPWLVVFSGFAAMLVGFMLILMQINSSGWQGRLIMPAAATYAVLITSGIARLLGSESRAAFLLIGAWIIFLLLALILVYLPTYLPAVAPNN